MILKILEVVYLFVFKQLFVWTTEFKKPVIVWVGLVVSMTLI